MTNCRDYCVPSIKCLYEALYRNSVTQANELTTRVNTLLFLSAKAGCRIDEKLLQKKI